MNNLQVKKFLSCVLSIALVCVPCQFVDAGLIKNIRQNRQEVRQARQDGRQAKQAIKQNARYARKTSPNASYGGQGGFSQPSAGSHGGGYGVVYSVSYDVVPSNGSHGGSYQTTTNPASSSCPYCTGNQSAIDNQEVTTPAPQASIDSSNVIVVSGPTAGSVVIARAPNVSSTLVVKGPIGGSTGLMLASL